MTATRSFEILFRKKIPYWSALLMGLMATFFTVLFLLYFIMLPADKVSGEMQVAYYIIVVPEWLKQASAYSFIGLLLLMPIYSLSKSYQLALLVLEENTMRISGAHMDRVLPVNKITKIMINDLRYIVRKPKEAIEVVIKHRVNKTTSFLLRHYIQAEELMEAFSTYENIAFVFYNESSMVTHDDEND
jgi:hypothetical protein